MPAKGCDEMSTRGTTVDTAASSGSEPGAVGRKRVAGLSTFAALVAGAITLVLPTTASADALVSNAGHGQDCAFFFGGKVYGGSGTEVVTPNGRVNLTCHLSLLSGTSVD